MNEILWIMFVLFIFLVSLGFYMKDPITHLFAFVVGILLMMELFSYSVYFGFIMGIFSIFIAYIALVRNWNT